MRTRFQYGVVLVVTAAMAAAMLVESRYTRPSDHGLSYQTAPKGNSTPQMAAFFGGSSSKADVALPKALNSTQPAWYRGGGGGGKVLLVASLVCGITGVALLVVVAFLFVGQYRSRQRESCSPLDK
ncbi:hypothetical protein AAG906_004947 [Vitis piasezkii]